MLNPTLDSLCFAIPMLFLGFATNPFLVRTVTREVRFSVRLQQIIRLGRSKICLENMHESFRGYSVIYTFSNWITRGIMVISQFSRIVFFFWMKRLFSQSKTHTAFYTWYISLVVRSSVFYHKKFTRIHEFSC